MKSLCRYHLRWFSILSFPCKSEGVNVAYALNQRFWLTITFQSREDASMCERWKAKRKKNQLLFNLIYFQKLFSCKFRRRNIFFADFSAENCLTCRCRGNTQMLFNQLCRLSAFVAKWICFCLATSRMWHFMVMWNEKRKNKHKNKNWRTRLCAKSKQFISS